MISDMHEEAARLQEANEKVLTELRHVEFENSFSSAMMIQNMKSFQDFVKNSTFKLNLTYPFPALRVHFWT